VFFKWERGNILDGFGDVLTCPPKPIKKSTFGCLVNLKEKLFKNLARAPCKNDNTQKTSIEKEV
jgi:hypothetical protein